MKKALRVYLVGLLLYFLIVFLQQRHIFFPAVFADGDDRVAVIIENQHKSGADAVIVFCEIIAFQLSALD